MSTPITWDEVDDVLPADFTIATVPARFVAMGDLHAGIDETAYSLETLLGGQIGMSATVARIPAALKILDKSAQITHLQPPQTASLA